MRIARVLLIVCALFASASAENKSWNAVKNRLPPGTYAVITIDGKALRASTLFGKALAGYFARYRDFDLAVQAIKALCGIDPATAVTDATGIAHGGIARWWVLGLDGIDAAKALDCGKKTAAVMAKVTVSAKTDGALTEYTWDDGSRKPKTISLAWIAKDVVVLTTWGDKRSYDGIDAGKPAGADLAAVIAKASAGAPAAWAAAALPKPDPGGNVGGHLAVTIAKGTVNVTGRLLTNSTDARSKELPVFQKQLAKLMDREKAPELQRVWKAFKLAESGNDITVELAAAEDDFLALLPFIEGL